MYRGRILRIFEGNEPQKMVKTKSKKKKKKMTYGVLRC